MSSRFVLLSLLFMSTRAFAIGVDDAIKQATESSHELAVSKLEYESADASVTKAWSEFMPKVELTGRHLFSEKFQILELEFGGAPIAMPAIQPYTSIGVMASYDLFDGFRSVNDVRAANAAREATELRLSREQKRLRANVRTAFYRALGSQILVEVADQNIKTLEEHLRTINARVRSGVSTRFDSLRTEVQLEEAKTEKLAAEDNVATARAALFRTIGIVDDGKPLSGQLPEDFAAVDSSKKVDEIKREDREALRLDVEARGRLASAAKAHWMPKVSLFGQQEWYDNTNHSIFEDDNRFKSAYAVGVLLKWNLFDGGAAYASQKQASLAHRIAAEKLAAVDESLPVEIDNARRRLAYDIASFKARQGSIRKAEEAVRLATSGVKAGMRTNTELLDAVVDLNKAKAAAVRSQTDAIEAQGALELALGQ